MYEMETHWQKAACKSKRNAEANRTKTISPYGWYSMYRVGVENNTGAKSILIRCCVTVL